MRTKPAEGHGLTDFVEVVGGDSAAASRSTRKFEARSASSTMRFAQTGTHRFARSSSRLCCCSRRRYRIFAPLRPLPSLLTKGTQPSKTRTRALLNESASGTSSSSWPTRRLTTVAGFLTTPRNGAARRSKLFRGGFRSTTTVATSTVLSTVGMADTIRGTIPINGKEEKGSI